MKKRKEKKKVRDGCTNLFNHDITYFKLQYI